MTLGLGNHWIRGRIIPTCLEGVPCTSPGTIHVNFAANCTFWSCAAWHNWERSTAFLETLAISPKKQGHRKLNITCPGSPLLPLTTPASPTFQVLAVGDPLGEGWGEPEIAILAVHVHRESHGTPSWGNLGSSVEGQRRHRKEVIG